MPYDPEMDDAIRELVREAQPLPDTCPSCHQTRDDIDRRYSYSYYAGIMCEDCARSKYRDACGLDGEMSDPRTLDDYGNDGDY